MRNFLIRFGRKYLKGGMNDFGLKLGIIHQFCIMTCCMTEEFYGIGLGSLSSKRPAFEFLKND